MFRRYWLPAIALGLILTGSAYAKDVVQRQGGSTGTKQTQSHPQGETQRPIAPSLQDSVNGISAAIKAAGNKTETPEEKQSSKENLEAQLDMSKSARKMFWVGVAETSITFVGVMLILATLIYTKQAAEAARASARIAERALRDLERPILFPKDVGMATRPNTPGEYHVAMDIRNYGRTAALLERVMGTLSLVIRENKNVRAAQERMLVYEYSILLEEGAATGYKFLSISPGIAEYMDDIRRGKIEPKLYISIQYHSLVGVRYYLSIDYYFSSGDSKFIRNSHYESVQDKRPKEFNAYEGDEI
jgi:hypothetical protein